MSTSAGQKRGVGSHIEYPSVVIQPVAALNTGKCCRSTTLDTWTEDQLKVQLHAARLPTGVVRAASPGTYYVLFERASCASIMCEQTMMVGGNQRGRQFFKQHGWYELGADKIEAKVGRRPRRVVTMYWPSLVSRAQDVCDS